MTFLETTVRKLEERFHQLDLTMGNLLQQVQILDTALVKDGERHAIQIESLQAQLDVIEKRLADFNRSHVETI